MQQEYITSIIRDKDFVPTHYPTLQYNGPVTQKPSLLRVTIWRELLDKLSSIMRPDASCPIT